MINFLLLAHIPNYILWERTFYHFQDKSLNQLKTKHFKIEVETTL